MENGLFLIVKERNRQVSEEGWTAEHDDKWLYGQLALAAMAYAIAAVMQVTGLAQRKAWDALSRYKFWMFGYWAAIWVHLNRISKAKLPNPWAELVKHSRKVVGDA